MLRGSTQEYRLKPVAHFNVSSLSGNEEGDLPDLMDAPKSAKGAHKK
jgi:hypothetical protein